MALPMWKWFLVFSCFLSMACLAQSQDTLSPNVTCPGDKIQYVEPSQQDAAVTWDVSASDNVDELGPANVTCRNDSDTVVSSGDRFLVGVHIITCSATDSAGNEGNCTFTITVTVDAKDPVVTCPADITQYVEPSQQDAAVTWDVSASDNVDELGPANVTCRNDSDTVVSSGDRFLVGVHIITCSATDSAGNEGNCTFTITVTVDAEDPVVTCPADITQYVEPSQQDAAVTWDVWASDNVDELGPANVTCRNDSDTEVSSGDRFLVGVHIITCSATDSAGNEGNCTFTITVTVDAEDPVVTCPADITQYVEPSQQDAAVTWDVWASDNVDELGPANVTCRNDSDTEVSSGDRFLVGVHIITCSATDSAGNEGNCTFTITVTVDAKDPVVTCPADITQYVEPSQQDAAVTWDVSASDNVDELGPANVTCRNDSDTVVSSGDRFLVGVHIITCSATDSAGNEGNCTFTITVTVDAEDPVVTCPADITQYVEPSQQDAAVTWDVWASDNVDELGPANVTCRNDSDTEVSSGDRFLVGVHIITCSATDSAGNEGNCTFTITVTVDAEDPVVTCPADITQYVEPSQQDAAVTWDVWASDNVDELGPANVTCRNDSDTEVSSGDRFLVGVHIITCSATDSAGNEGNCTFTITVTVDAKDPVVTCPADITQYVEPSQQDAAVTWDVWASDNVDELGPANVTCRNDSDTEVSSGDRFLVGVHIITCSATDSAGNEGNCTFTITVTVDAEDPVVTCPADITQYVEPSQQDAAVTWDVWASDNVDELGPANVTCRNDSDTEVSSGDRFLVGVHIITCSATDSAGNEGNCTFTITVTVDAKDPVVTCPADITQYVEPSQQDAAVTWDVSASDNVDELGPANVTCRNDSDTVVSSGDRFLVGVHIITCSATDSAGNEGNCTFTITVTVDAEDPVVTCPADITQYVEPSQQDAAVTWDVWASDNVDELGPANVTCRNDSDTEVSSGDRFLVGVHIITCSATDSAGNEGNCTFTITVTVDAEDPVVTCPADITQYVEPSQQDAAVTWDVWASDNVDELGPANVTCRNDSDTEVSSGDRFLVGVHIITCSATDSAGNEGNCTFTITVTVDAKDPVVTCPADITQYVEPSQQDAAVTWDVSASDNVDELGPANVTCRNDSDTEVSSGDRFLVGVHIITCSATDSAGNEGNCTFTITVTVDAEDPVVTCPANIIQYVEPSQLDAVVNWNVSVSDNVDELGPANVTCRNDSDTEVSSGDRFLVGVHIITCSATDSAGNEGNCTFTITVTVVTDNPVVTCPSNITQYVEPSRPDAAVYWNVSVSDNSDDLGPANVTCKDGSDRVVTSGDRFPVGVHIITCSATDSAGNKGSCTFNITVTDDEAPSITCPDDRSVNVAEGKLTASVTWVSTANDVVDGKLDTSCNPQQGMELTGVTRVMCMASDASYNHASCDFSITVTVDGQNCSDKLVSGCMCDDSKKNCVCKEGFSGPNCEGVDGSSCPLDSPAPNCDCTDTPCKCKPGFKGELCDECQGCMNGGSFQDIATCQCECPSEGYEAPICSDCQECVNGGYQNEYTCVCECRGLYEGDLCDVCPNDNVCENGGTMNRETCSCECSDEWAGTNCEESVPTLPEDEYPDPPEGVDIEKKVSIEIEVTSDGNCNATENKTSPACQALQSTFIAGVELEYKSLAGFKRVQVTDLRSGSVIIQHEAIYNYTAMSPSQRGISALDLYLATTAKAVEKGKLGNLTVAPECGTCQAPKDETNMCKTTPPECGKGFKVVEVKEGSSCYFVCRASCKVQTEYCNGGTCAQDSEGVMSCSCPQNTEFMYIGVNCQLAVNLLWLYIGCGLGGGVLVILIFTLVCCVLQYRKKVKTFESEEEDEESEDGEMRGEIRTVHHRNKGFVGDSSSVAEEHPAEGETRVSKSARPYSYIYRNGVSRSSSGAAAAKNRYESSLGRDRERDSSSDHAEESGGKTRGSYFWGNLTVPVKEDAEVIPMSGIDPTKMYKIQRPQISLNRNDDLPERDYF